MKLIDLKYDTDIEELPCADIISLQNNVQLLTEQDIQPAIDVLSEYYGLHVSDAIIRNIFLTHLKLAYETITGGISDTCQRDILVYALLQFIGINMYWPTYGDSEEYSRKFHTLLKETCDNMGIEFVNKQLLKSYM